MGSTWRRLLEENDGRLPEPSEQAIAGAAGHAKAEHIQRLLPSVSVDACRLVKQIERRVGLPKLWIYVARGDEVQKNSAFLDPSSGSIFVAENLLESPLGHLEGTLLHEIGHGFQTDGFLNHIEQALSNLKALAAPESSLGIPIALVSSCLYTPLSLMHNLGRVFYELDADRFAVRHAGDPSARLEGLEQNFPMNSRCSVPKTDHKSPFTPVAVVNELLFFLDNLPKLQHPPTSIRYVLAAREAAKEQDRRKL